ncbi:hypothetical protein FRB97_005328 [Tulasnella sp. 331]|nr:hypothetical protein FRB97_005328 [Tulasnella sp. 331]
MQTTSSSKLHAKRFTDEELNGVKDAFGGFFKDHDRTETKALDHSHLEGHPEVTRITLKKGEITHQVLAVKAEGKTTFIEVPKSDASQSHIPGSAKKGWSTKKKVIVGGAAVAGVGALGYEVVKHRKASAAEAAAEAEDTGGAGSMCPGQGGADGQTKLTSDQKSQIQSQAAGGCGAYTEWLLICNSPYTPDDWSWVNATVSAAPLLPPVDNSAFTSTELLQINSDLCSTSSTDGDQQWYQYYNSTVIAYPGWDGEPAPTSSDLSAINNADCAQVQAAVTAFENGGSDSSAGGTNPSGGSDDGSGDA